MHWFKIRLKVSPCFKSHSVYPTEHVTRYWHENLALSKNVVSGALVHLHDTDTRYWHDNFTRWNVHTLYRVIMLSMDISVSEPHFAPLGKLFQLWNFWPLTCAHGCWSAPNSVATFDEVLSHQGKLGVTRDSDNQHAVDVADFFNKSIGNIWTSALSCK